VAPALKGQDSFLLTAPGGVLVEGHEWAALGEPDVSLAQKIYRAVGVTETVKNGFSKRSSMLRGPYYEQFKS
jgi:hypothetical protein